MSDALRILAIFLLVLGNAVFVAAEYALVTARRTRLEPEADAGSRRARAALDLMEHPVKFIGTVQIGITVFGIALGAVGQPLLTDYFEAPLSHGVAYALAFVVLTYLSVALGELVPKALALQRAEGIAKTLAIPLEILQTVTKPFTWLLQVSANAVTRLFGVTPARAGELAHTEEDIRHIVAASEDAGVIATTEEEMLYKVFDFADKYGAMQGIVTLEDLLEEIVGEIEDEFDLPDESVERVDETHIRIDGTFPIDDFNEQFGSELEAEDYHTMAGIAFGALGRAPEVGDEIDIDGLRLRVIQIEGSRIQRLEVEFTAPIPEPEAVE